VAAPAVIADDVVSNYSASDRGSSTVTWGISSSSTGAVKTHRQIHFRRLNKAALCNILAADLAIALSSCQSSAVAHRVGDGG
jgi:hypothetical protein